MQVGDHTDNRLLDIVQLKVRVAIREQRSRHQRQRRGRVEPTPCALVAQIEVKPQVDSPAA
jgi:hypothetical protein